MPLREDYLTIAEASKFLGVTRQTVSRWIKEHKFSVEKIGRQMLLDTSDVVEFQTAILGSTILNLIKFLATQHIRYSDAYWGNDVTIKFKKIIDKNVYQFTVLKADKTVDIINYPVDLQIGYKNKKYYLELMIVPNLKLLIVPDNKGIKQEVQSTDNKE